MARVVEYDIDKIISHVSFFVCTFWIVVQIRGHHGCNVEDEFSDPVPPTKGELAVAVELTVQALSVEGGTFEPYQSSDTTEKRRIIC